MPYSTKKHSAEKIATKLRTTRARRLKRLGKAGEAARQRRNYLRYAYGVTPEWYDTTLKQQGGVCAICHTNPHKTRALHIDHNHKTKRIRGILCWNCNVFVGYLERAGRVRLIDNFLAYLRKHA